MHGHAVTQAESSGRTVFEGEAQLAPHCIHFRVLTGAFRLQTQLARGPCKVYPELPLKMGAVLFPVAQTICTELQEYEVSPLLFQKIMQFLAAFGIMVDGAQKVELFPGEGGSDLLLLLPHPAGG